MKYNDGYTRHRIIALASELLQQKGIRGWNMDKLSQKAGLAKNTLYRTIGTKEDLMKEVLLHQITETQAKLVALTDRNLPYRSILEEMVQVFPELLAPLFTGLIQDIFNEFPAIEEEVKKHRNIVTERIILFFKKGVAEGELTKDLNPQILFEMLQGIVLYSLKAADGEKDLKNRLSLSFRYLLDGIYQ